MVFSIHDSDVASDAVAAAVEVEQLLGSRARTAADQKGMENARKLMEAIYRCSLRSEPAVQPGVRWSKFDAEFLDRSTATALAVVFTNLDSSLKDVFRKLPDLIRQLHEIVNSDVTSVETLKLERLRRFFLELSRYATGQSYSASLR
jgi:hypothetical protein